MNATDEGHTSPPENPAPPAPRHARLTGYDTFVERVRKACTSPGTQQALRRGLAKPVHEVPARTHAALLRDGLVPDEVKGEERRAHYAVAALIAARPRAERVADTRDDQGTAEQLPGVLKQPPDGTPPATEQKPSWGTSLGTSLARAVISDRDRENGIESRLHLLVRQETDGLHRMLPAVMRLLGSTGVPADYGRLLHDIAHWTYRREESSTRWLEDYYRTLRRARQSDRGGN
ncbi:type I-E CRISPR-associated protein Cse2/CasB [Streptomyces sp. WMMC1477]|uniref:type I-E CRISPR-associated protein Cse2/CasB n=1 Tax=Streptomyces sp. WMMC1477 TaxID=3015155 RepID=UPI0022B74E97|nr:type I-E CRISPR-associated protein Cse2/CasB [Streptomyces sp. WMMC1477]MCZ7430384.1 type I-E CRISPR-associated protein Cse2/CasB [Streptomyces sp. WMMC1477]